MSCHHVSMSFLPSAVSPKMSKIVTKTWQHMAKNDILTWWHDMTSKIMWGPLLELPDAGSWKKKWVENLLFWWSNHIITICHNLSQFVTFWSDSMWQKWHTDMTTWHDITNKVTHTSTRTIHRFLKKNGVKTLKIEGVRAILVTWCLKKPNFLNNCRR